MPDEEEWGTIALGNPLGQGMGKKVALLVGVGSYGGGLKQLACPAKGVEALGEVLADGAIAGFDQVVPLVDPDVGSFRARMGEVFTPLAKDDLALFYFTGHGINEMGGDFYLTTCQTHLFDDRRLNLGTAIEASFIKTIFRNTYAQRKVIILDCCFGAAFAEGFLTMDDGQVDVQRDLGGEGWVVLTAATARNYALEQEGEPLSVYTRYLVEGLKTGAAAPEGYDQITVGQLHDYVRQKVTTAAPTMRPAIFNGLAGQAITLARAVINPELIYRQKVESCIRKGRIAPAERRISAEWRIKLGLDPERAKEIEAEVLKPHIQRQHHLDVYIETLREEIADEFPLSREAIRELRELQKLWNLSDQDLEPEVSAVLGEMGNVPQSFGEIMLNPPVEAATPATIAAAEVIPALVERVTPSLETWDFEVVTVDAQGKVTKRQGGSAEYHRETLPGEVGLDVVKIPAGAFWMGQTEVQKAKLIRQVGETHYKKYFANENPRHRVQVPGFWLGKYAITQAQWRVVAGLPTVQIDLDADPSNFKGDDLPVEQVSWYEAVEFCDRLTAHTNHPYRLPSEAEWEYACRAGTETPYYCGETITPDLANYYGNYTYGQEPKGTYREKTTPVGSFPPNRFGLYDMHGNVLEWCQDHWHDSYEGAPTDGSAWLSSGEEIFRLVRGGSWFNVTRHCRCASRVRNEPDDRSNLLGFRVVASLVWTS